MFDDNALYWELVTLILRVVWFNGTLFLNAKAYKFKTSGTWTLYIILAKSSNRPFLKLG